MEKPLVSIRCTVYNHEPYIRQCLDGFVMQKTNFPFEAIVHDDASTDHSADIIREYAAKYPDIIKPIYETENQWSKQDGSLSRIMNKACTGKYIAICEGDDYWIDPLKLQKQVDYLEVHPFCDMVCSKAKRYSEKSKGFIDDIICRKNSVSLSPKDIILKGGLYIATASILYRKDVKDFYPKYCTNCHVGDYPLQIMCAMKGKVFYFDEPMVVYRVENSNSWVGKSSKSEASTELYQRRILDVRSELEMLEGFAKDYPQYKYAFYERMCFFLNAQLHNGMKEDMYNIYVRELTSFMNKRNWLWRLDARMRHTLPSLLYKLISKIYEKVAAHTYLRKFN